MSVKIIFKFIGLCIIGFFLSRHMGLSITESGILNVGLYWATLN